MAARCFAWGTCQRKRTETLRSSEKLGWMKENVTKPMRAVIDLLHQNVISRLLVFLPGCLPNAVYAGSRHSALFNHSNCFNLFLILLWDKLHSPLQGQSVINPCSSGLRKQSWLLWMLCCLPSGVVKMCAARDGEWEEWLSVLIKLIHRAAFVLYIYFCYVTGKSHGPS